MRRSHTILWASLCLIPSSSLVLAADLPYSLSFSTYFGGSNWEHSRDVVADAAGNIYVVGGTASNNFPTTAGTFSQTYNAGISGSAPGQGAFGSCDAFVAKFNSTGQLQWSTYLGGPAYDRAYGVEVDATGNVYVAGRAGPAFPTTGGAFQQTFAGTTGGSGDYGHQNGFVTKLSPAGSMVWSSYVGVGELCRDIAIDAAGDVYVPLTRASNKTSAAMPAAFANAFANSTPTPNANGSSGIVKIKGDGSEVMWARWLGGSGVDRQETAVRTDNSGNVFVAFSTQSADAPTAGVGADTTYNGGDDMYLAKLNATTSALLMGTYVGGSGSETSETHGLAVDNNGNAYMTMFTTSTAASFGVTAGTVGTTRQGTADIAIAKIDGTTGARTFSTYVGGNGSENPDGVYVDANTGRIFVVAETNSTNFPITANAFQSTNGGSTDGAIFVLSADMKTIEYATYLGGTSYDNGRTAFLGTDGSVYIAGGTTSTNFPTLNAYQTTFKGGNNPFGAGSGDTFLAKFSLVAVPEPSSLGMLMLGGGTMLRRWRQR